MAVKWNHNPAEIPKASGSSVTTTSRKWKMVVMAMVIPMRARLGEDGEERVFVHFEAFDGPEPEGRKLWYETLSIGGRWYYRKGGDLRLIADEDNSLRAFWIAPIGEEADCGFPTIHSL